MTSNQKKLVTAARFLIAHVEGTTDEYRRNGARLKDSPEWAKFYIAVAHVTPDTEPEPEESNDPYDFDYNRWHRYPDKKPMPQDGTREHGYVLWLRGEDGVLVESWSKPPDGVRAWTSIPKAEPDGKKVPFDRTD